MKHTTHRGKVYLIGAGPGDPGLLTLRGLEIIQSADAIVYDGLVNPSILHFAPAAEKIYAGKYGAKTQAESFCSADRVRLDAHLRQNLINRKLVQLARRGKIVARLKGGDPFVFGRGGEEASYLKKSGIPFEIVPGVSAGNGVPAYAGIPVTDRRLASVAAFVTAHEDPAKKSSVDWRPLAQLNGTLILFMTVKTLPSVTEQLIQFGKSPKTPISIIEWGTLPEQRVVEGTLATIAGKIRKEKILSPALAVIGEVTRLRKKLAWFERKRLIGKTVLVTRGQSQSTSLRRELEKEGARVWEFPVIKIAPPQDWTALDQALKRISNFDWVLFTSVNGVDFVFHRLWERGKDVRLFSKAKIGAVGEATAKRLLDHGIRADFVPNKFTTADLLEELKEKYPIQGRRFLLPRTDIAPPELRRGLENSGAAVTEITAYRTIPAVESQEKKKLYHLLKSKQADFITFTSSSTVQYFFDALPKKFRLKKSRLVSIGPITSKTLKDYGYRPYREAKKHTIEGLVEAMTNGK